MEMAAQNMGNAISLADHLSKTSPQLQELFLELNNRICRLGNDVSVRIVIPYIGYWTLNKESENARLFVEVHIQKEKIKLHLLPAKYNDPLNEISVVAKTNKWTLDHNTFIYNEEQLLRKLEWVSQSYQKACMV